VTGQEVFIAIARNRLGRELSKMDTNWDCQNVTDLLHAVPRRGNAVANLAGQARHDGWEAEGLHTAPSSFFIIQSKSLHAHIAGNVPVLAAKALLCLLQEKKQPRCTPGLVVVGTGQKPDR
jgi:hypothetical protein